MIDSGHDAVGGLPLRCDAADAVAVDDDDDADDAIDGDGVDVCGCLQRDATLFLNLLCVCFT